MEEERKQREEEERVRREKEEQARSEMFRLIKEEEDRLQRREEEKKKREREYYKKKKQIFELCFDDELVDVQKLLGIADAKGQCQRACKQSPADRLLCVCLADPFYRGPQSSTTFVEPFCQDENDNTPLSEAAVGGAMEVLQELLKHGAHAVIDLPDNHGRTPVFRAAFMGKVEAVKMLMKYGADVTIRNKENDSPTDAAADPEVKAALETYSEEAANQAKAALEKEASSAWRPPTPEPDPADLVPKTDHSAKIGLRGLADTLDDIKKAGRRQTLIVDLSGNAQTYLRYRDNNLLMAYKPGDITAENVRKALLGALRFGKPLVIDNGDLKLEWNKFKEWFDSVLPGLWEMVWGCSINKDGNFMKIVKKEDGDNFKEQNFNDHCLNSYQFIVVSKLPQVPADFADHFFLLTAA